MKKLFSVLLAVLMLAALCGIASAETGIGIEPGETMPDFTATLTDGTAVTLSELLKEKDLVVLNLFASFCKPCEKEFPEMEKIYQANRDRMEIVALSAYSEDTMEVIADYKESHALSFPMGLTGEDLSFLEISGYPTTIIIDHNGKVGLVKVGAFVGEGEFEEKVNYFLSADYSGESLSFEKAVSFTQYIIYALVFVTVNTLALAIGRWGMLRKAGKKGWHSLIPFLNVWNEYALCWKGWIGLAADLSWIAFFALAYSGVPTVVRYGLLLLSFVIGIPEGFRLAKVYGQGKAVGFLLAIPGLKDIVKMILGVSKAKYRLACAA